MALIFTFFDISYKGSIKLPGYFDNHHPLEGEASALLQLEKILKQLGGNFYRFGEQVIHHR